MSGGRPRLNGSVKYDVGELLAYIVGYKRGHDGLSPTIREMQAACGISSTSVTTWLLDKLEGQGKVRLLRGEGGVLRGVMVVGGRWDLPPGPLPEGRGDRKGRGRPKLGVVVLDMDGDLTGKVFGATELRTMVKLGALREGSVYEIEGMRGVVGEGGV